ncbi:MAG: hypothetical protein Q8R08_03175 [bacterium]|nr:hypothetical protein [bacterium]
MNAQYWGKLSLAEQLGNIGSEFSRYVSFAKREESSLSAKSLEEVIALLDLTISDRRWLSALKELARLREVIRDFFGETRQYEIEAENLKDYFMPFAILARNRH